MPDEVILDVTTIEENVTVETTAGDVVEIQVVAPAGPAGATGPAGPNSVTSATTSDGTANLSLSNVSTATATVSGLLTAGHIHGNLAGTLYTHVRTGEAMSKGDPFYISGFHVGSSQPIAMKADASNAAKMPAVGVMDADYANNTSSANGIISGTLSSVDTDGYAVNSPIYVADGGGYSNTAGTIPQQVGITERDNANTGAFIVTSPKLISFADITDSETGTATLGLSSISIYPSGKIYYASTNSGGFVGLSGQLATDARDVYLPNASGNLALVTSTTGQIASADVSGLTALATTTPGTNVATFLETPTSANLASALTDENGTGGGFVRAEGATLTSPSIAGTAEFTGTTRPTSAGTGTPAATSLMTRDDVALEPFYNLGNVFRVSATPAFANSGTGSAATQSAGDRWAALSSGTANSGWGRAQIGRGITTVPSLSGTGINFASKLGVSIVLWLGNSVATDNLNIFRLRFGSDNTPVADGVDAVAYRGFGVEIKARGSTHDWRVYGHNGTSITYSAWSNTGLTPDILRTRIFLSVMSNGSGTITASLGTNGSRTLSTITTTGGPTTSGVSAQAFVEAHVANSASGTLPLSAALYDAMFYAQI